ncbi:unnamed protein product [Rhodiola kirilowii]
MGKKRPCCDKIGLKKGPWSSEEDQVLVSYIAQHGHGRWRSLPKLAGLSRCGKSCRLRWTNYLRPDIKRGPFTEEEEKLVIHSCTAFLEIGGLQLLLSYLEEPITRSRTCGTLI